MIIADQITITRVRGSEQRMDSMRVIRSANQVGSLADDAVRALLRIKRGMDSFRSDPALKDARVFVETLAEEASPRPRSLSSFRVSKLMDANDAFLEPPTGHPSASHDSYSEKLLALAEMMRAIESGQNELGDIDDALRRFEALAEATHEAATEASRAHAGHAQWSLT